MDTKILRSKILDLAIRGKLVEQDAADGSALDLLAQIGKERGSVIKPLTEDTPFDIPDNWCWVKISDVAESILYGVSESAKREGKYKLLRITDIQDNQVDWDTVPLTNYDEKKVDKYLLKKGDIVFARTGATVGKSFLIDKEVVNAIYASYLIRVRLFNLCDEHYIIDFFNSPEYWSQITMNSVGVGQPNCNGTALGNLIFPLPPLAEQKRIVAKVEELLAEVDKIEKAQKDMADTATALQAKVLMLLFKPSESWEPRLVGDCFVSIKNGATIQQKKGAGGIPITRIETLSNDRFNRDRLGYADVLDISPYEKYHLADGDILMSHINSMQYLGRSVVYRKQGDEQIIHGMNLLRFVPKEEVDSDFAVYYFSTEYFRSQVRLKAHHAVNQASINVKSLSSLTFPLPPLAEQKRIVAKVEELLADIDKLK